MKWGCHSTCVLQIFVKYNVTKLTVENALLDGIDNYIYSCYIDSVTLLILKRPHIAQQVNFAAQ